MKPYINIPVTASNRVFDIISRYVCILAVALLAPIGCADLPKEILDEANKPVPKEFLLGPEDVVEVTVWRNQDLSRTTTVRPDGMISLPLIGDVQASGFTSGQVADRIAKRLTEFKENPSVSVNVKEVNSYYVYVMGEVVKPGKYPLKSYATVLQGVSLAGGFTPFASRNSMIVLRTIRNGKGEEHHIRIPAGFDNLLKGRGQISNFTLISGDTIVVP